MQRSFENIEKIRKLKIHLTQQGFFLTEGQKELKKHVIDRYKAYKKEQEKALKETMLAHLDVLFNAAAHLPTYKKKDPRYHQLLYQAAQEMEQFIHLFLLDPRAAVPNYDKVSAALNVFSSLSIKQKMMFGKIIHSEMYGDTLKECPLLLAQLEDALADPDNQKHAEEVEALFKKFTANPNDNVLTIRLYLNSSFENSSQHITHLLGVARPATVPHPDAKAEKSSPSIGTVITAGVTAASALLAWHHSPHLFGKHLADRVVGTLVTSALTSTVSSTIMNKLKG